METFLPYADSNVLGKGAWFTTSQKRRSLLFLPSGSLVKNTRPDYCDADHYYDDEVQDHMPPSFSPSHLPLWRHETHRLEWLGQVLCLPDAHFCFGMSRQNMEPSRMEVVRAVAKDPRRLTLQVSFSSSDFAQGNLSSAYNFLFSKIHGFKTSQESICVRTTVTWPQALGRSAGGSQFGPILQTIEFLRFQLRG